MESENITICPICESQRFTHFTTVKDCSITKEVFELITCSRCGLTITNPRPTADFIGKYYASVDYISHSGKSKTLFDKIYLTARNITLRWKHKLITDYSAQPGNILDFGCGTGEFLNFMKKKNWRVSGIEPNETARKKANELLENRVSKDLTEINDQPIDIITLWHVLEHVHDLNNTLLKLKALLKPNGHIIIAVPNPNSHDSKHYENNWAAYDVPRHLWHFTRSTMTALLNKNGLKVVEIRPMKLDSYYVSLLSEGYKYPRTSKIIAGVKAFIEGSISNLSARKNKEYSSLIYISKPE
jgi:2-polyprenyl-3-methyl-5-hydroxy-6-metoxy-1,4-benzoquinol methylase